VHLGSIELLNVNAQPLHNVKIIQWKSIEGLCNQCLPLLKNSKS
jgi:hypothetical protein